MPDVETAERLARIEAEIVALRSDIARYFDGYGDHEQRIRELERLINFADEYLAIAEEQSQQNDELETRVRQLEIAQAQQAEKIGQFARVIVVAMMISTVVGNIVTFYLSTR